MRALSNVSAHRIERDGVSNVMALDPMPHAAAHLIPHATHLDASLQCARGDPIGFRSLPAQLRLLFAALTVDHGHVSLEPAQNRPPTGPPR